LSYFLTRSEKATRFHARREGGGGRRQFYFSRKLLVRKKIMKATTAKQVHELSVERFNAKNN